MIRILVVDEHEPSRKMLEVVLRRSGYDFVAAETPLEARRLIANEGETYSLAIVDQRFGKDDRAGFELAKELFGDPTKPCNPVILIATTTEPNFQDEIIASDIPVITKPYSPQRLLAFIAYVLTHYGDTGQPQGAD